MSINSRAHISFLLRMWRVNSPDERAWHISLEDPMTGERKGFASMDALIGYLESLVGNEQGETTVK